MNPESWQRVKHILADALEQPPSDREGYLRTHCSDAETYEYLRALLAHDSSPTAAPFVVRPAGSTLGHYILRELMGRGGMGEVYRAEDTQLAREVAIKVLSQSATTDPIRRARLEREAFLLAALSHPNVAAVYGLEQDGDAVAIVMELIPGPTLAEKVSDGPLPLRECLRIALHIASGLEAAHERGVVHRDLKPSNVKLAGDTAKILDFGLAKAVDHVSAPASDPAITMPNAIMGTLTYMSPEQARGQSVDRRTDVWAFGCVLFEMLTGAPPFAAKHPSDQIAAILTSSADLRRLPPTTPAALRTLLERCLQHDTRRRLQSIGEARIVLEDLLDGGEAQDAKLSPRAWWPMVASATAIAGVLIAAGVWLSPRSVRDGRPVSMPVTKAGLHLEGARTPSFAAISPDGTRVAYVAGPRSQIYVRRLDERTARPVEGTERATELFFSPSGDWIGYTSSRELRKVPSNGGRSVLIASGLEPQPSAGHDWTGDGYIVFATEHALVRVHEQSGSLQTLASLPDDGSRLGSPHVLPGGHAVLLSTWTDDVAAGRVELLDLRSGDLRPIVGAAIGGQYVPSPGDAQHGFLIYQAIDGIYAAPFDTARPAAVTNAVRMVDDSATQQWGRARFSVSDTGTLLYVPATGGETTATLNWMDRSGHLTVVPAPTGDYAAATLSPDGSRVALQVRHQNAPNQIAVVDVSRGTATLLPTKGHSVRPIWSPDGQQVAFRSKVDGANDTLASARADGSGPVAPLTFDPLGFGFPDSWARNGKIFGSTGKVIWSLSPTSAESSAPEPLIISAGSKAHVAISPANDRLVAFDSDVTGVAHVYVQTFEPVGERLTVSIDGGRMPRWNPDGSRLFYLGATSIMQVEVLEPTSPRLGPPSTAVQIPDDTVAFDVDPLHDRFFVVRRSPLPATADEVHLVINWTDELARASSRNR